MSHAAWDHLGDAAEIARRTGAPIGCPADVAEKVIEEGVPAAQVRALIWGVCYAFGEIVVRPVECHHWTSTQLRDGRHVAGVPLSFIVETEPGVRIYHFGDTAIFPGLALIGELYRPTVGIIGCAQTDGLPDPGAGRVLTGEMNPDEAARAAGMLGVRHLVASHYIHPGPEVAELRRLAPPLRRDRSPGRPRAGRRRDDHDRARARGAAVARVGPGIRRVGSRSPPARRRRARAGHPVGGRACVLSSSSTATRWASA